MDSNASVEGRSPKLSSASGDKNSDSETEGAPRSSTNTFFASLKAFNGYNESQPLKSGGKSRRGDPCWRKGGEGEEEVRNVGEGVGVELRRDARKVGRVA